MHGQDVRVALGIAQIGARADPLARIGVRRPKQDPPQRADPRHLLGRQAQEVLSLAQRLVVAEALQMLVAVEETDHLDAVVDEAEGGGGDHRVGRRSRTA